MGGVVDGDDGVGDDPFGVCPAVGVSDAVERSALDEFEGGSQALLGVGWGGFGGGLDVTGEPFEVATEGGLTWYRSPLGGIASAPQKTAPVTTSAFAVITNFTPSGAPGHAGNSTNAM